MEKLLDLLHIRLNAVKRKVSQFLTPNHLLRSPDFLYVSTFSNSRGSKQGDTQKALIKLLIKLVIFSDPHNKMQT